MNLRRLPVIILLLLTATCGPLRATTIATPVPQALTPVPAVTAVAGLSADEVATLSSLEKVDDYPLYTMTYHGSYDQWWDVVADGRKTTDGHWACSLFAVLGSQRDALYGRNFDWDFSPAVLLFTDPPDGYASVSMVDVAYLGFDDTAVGSLTDLPLAGRTPLLVSPMLPFDGMNEKGLAIGMAAVPPGGVAPDPQLETIDSLGVMRKVLDRAATADEALAILTGYNIDFGGGPPIHYLVADKAGRSLLIEHYQGEVVVTPNDESWHLATNFIRASAGTAPGGHCDRYDRILRRLEERRGTLTSGEAVDLLSEVSQPGSTQWSIVYGMGTGQILVAMNRMYGSVHTFEMRMVGE